MKWFLKTVDVLRSDGIVVGKNVESHGEKIEFWFKRIQECQPIVFTVSKNENVPSCGCGDPNHHGHFGRIQSAPFKTFSVEMIGENSAILTSKSKEDIELENLVSNAAFTVGLQSTRVFCIIATETAPQEFSYIALIKHTNKGGEETFFVTRDAELSVRSGPAVGKSVRSLFTDIVNNLLEEFNTEKVGTENVRHSVKIGSGKDKKTFRIRRIVYVTPKKLHEGARLLYGKTIDWTHRWFVRGHWRSIVGLGKDREGNYAVSNFTWVTEHEKGPEDKPLIKKVRVVKGEENDGPRNSETKN